MDFFQIKKKDSLGLAIHIRLLVFVVASLFFALGNAGFVFAGTIGFAPSRGAFPVGKTFSVSIIASSADQAANAFSGQISFPADKLQVTGINKGGSIMGLWVQEPSFSNQAGTVNFEGIVLNPGFTGSGGRLLTVSFKAIAEGTAAVQFTSGSMLANDGQGTSILSGLGGATFEIGGVVEKPEVPEPQANVPSAPVISSESHPDQNRWYNDRIVDASWSIPRGVTGMSVVVDKEEATLPAARSSGLSGYYTTENLEDGQWFVHVRLRNGQGWGPAGHFRVQIDATAPGRPTIQFTTTTAEDPRPRVVVTSTDALSGIERYEFQVDDKEKFQVVAADVSAEKPYILDVQERGSHRLTVFAYDFAGNVADVTGDFQIIDMAPPRFEIVRVTKEGELIKIDVSTYADSYVELFVSDSEVGVIGRHKVWSGDTGNFTFIWPTPLPRGTYQLGGAVIDGSGARSPASIPALFTVRPSVWTTLGEVVFKILSLLLPIVILAALLYLLYVYGAQFIRSVLKRRKHRSKHINNIRREVRNEFNRFRNEVETRIHLLHKTRSRSHLTIKKRRMMRQMKDDIRTFEKAVNKKLNNLDKK